MKAIGAVMWIGGGVVTLFALFGFDTTIATSAPASVLPGMPDMPDRVVNLQLQQLQALIAHAGMALFVAGVIAHCAGNLAEALSMPTLAQRNSAILADQVGGEASAATVDTDEPDEVLMQRYGISQDGDQYVYATFRYSRLSDAVAYARKQLNG